MFGSQFIHLIQTNLRIVFRFEVLGLKNKDFFFLKFFIIVFLSSDQHTNWFFGVNGDQTIDFYKKKKKKRFYQLN